MSGSNWGRKHFTLTQALGASLSVMLILTVVWQWSAANTKHAIEAERYAEHYRDQAIESMKQLCQLPELVARIECEAKLLDSSREAQHDAYDLAAQRESAYWGRWTTWIAGGSAVVTLAGLWFVWGSLQEMQQQTKAALAGIRSRLSIAEASFVASKSGVLVIGDGSNLGSVSASWIEMTATLVIETDGDIRRWKSEQNLVGPIEGGTAFKAELMFTGHDIGQVFVLPACPSFMVSINMSWRDKLGSPENGGAVFVGGKNVTLTESEKGDPIVIGPMIKRQT